MLDAWSAETLADTQRWPDAGLVREGLPLFKELPRTARSEVLLATDLHAGNVASDPQGVINRMADLLGLDRERIRLWVFARASAEPREHWHGGWTNIARALARSI